MLLLDMEMPDNCYTCPFLDYEQGHCFADGKKSEYGFYTDGRGASDNKDRRADWCPIKGDTADVAPVRHAHWMFINGHLAPMFKCSNCRNIAFNSPYCPSCGAKMDEETEK